jgi:hypothetical protein
VGALPGELLGGVRALAVDDTTVADTAGVLGSCSTLAAAALEVQSMPEWDNVV